MKKRMLGHRGLPVTSVCIRIGPVDTHSGQLKFRTGLETAVATIQRVLEGPFNFMDASGEYWQGAEGSRRISRAIHEAGGLPDGFVLTSRVGPALGLDFSGDSIVRAVEESLQRLRLDSLPLVLLQDPEGLSLKAATAPGGPLGSLVGLRDQGLIRHLAIEGGPVDLQLKYLATDAFDAVFSHTPYNLMDRAAEPLIQNAVSREVAFVNAAPFTGSLLLQGAGTPPRRTNWERSPARLERSDKMRLICAAYSIPLAAAALQFSVLDPRVASTIVGVSTPSQAEFVADLAQWKIPAAAWDDLLDLVEETDLAVSCRDDVIPTTDLRLTGSSV